MAIVPWNEHLSVVRRWVPRTNTNCAKACGYMAGHVIFEIFGLQQLVLEEIISVKGVRREKGFGVKRVNAYDAN